MLLRSLAKLFGLAFIVVAAYFHAAACRRVQSHAVVFQSSHTFARVGSIVGGCCMPPRRAGLRVRPYLLESVRLWACRRVQVLLCFPSQEGNIVAARCL